MIKKWSKIVVNIVYGCCIIAIILLLIQIFMFTSFKIPSDSMEPSLLAGDYIWVNKCSKGARLFNVLDAIDKKPVTIHRMPGWRSFKRNDILVFNLPYPDRWDSITFDVMKYYVKRCVALPGDTFEIRNGRYHVRNCKDILGNLSSQEYLLSLLESGRAKEQGLVTRCYPYSGLLGWNVRDFGPLYIPAKGDTIFMTPKTKLVYRNLIEWEQKTKLQLRGDTVLLGDSAIWSYCFRENYYFVAGDKVLNSRDSRYWGLLPEPFIVGKAIRIWKSVDWDTNEIRWDRILKKVE
ncbi:signal peptidase I [Bacteroides intestinalis]|uniref:Signal peptidase I n=1 Tax=Bacteroides intestinalis TaxID=329854 RepID=A0A412Y121_9BACE|nr:signal peptidase I [Bacteroides intestinalis]RGV51253.1 signal peptidase I [Bacteroides intestinalis]RHA62673.1 signal peptidase I [Bacteroides intestinalis]